MKFVEKVFDSVLEALKEANAIGLLGVAVDTGFTVFENDDDVRRFISRLASESLLPGALKRFFFCSSPLDLSIDSDMLTIYLCIRKDKNGDDVYLAVYFAKGIANQKIANGLEKALSKGWLEGENMDMSKRRLKIGIF